MSWKKFSGHDAKTLRGDDCSTDLLPWIKKSLDLVFSGEGECPLMVQVHMLDPRIPADIHGPVFLPSLVSTINIENFAAWAHGATVQRMSPLTYFPSLPPHSAPGLQISSYPYSIQRCPGILYQVFLSTFKRQSSFSLIKVRRKWKTLSGLTNYTETGR